MTVCRQQKLVREAFGLSPTERLLLDERLYARSWKSSKEKTGEGLLDVEEQEQEEEEEDEEEVTEEELARLVEIALASPYSRIQITVRRACFSRLVEEPKLMGRDLRSLVSSKEDLNSKDCLLCLFCIL